MRLIDLFPNVEQLLALSHGQLAHSILRNLEREKRNAAGYNPGAAPAAENYALHDVSFEDYAHAERPEIFLAVKEAWAWMQRELILVHSEGQAPVFFNISRIGRAFLREENASAIDARKFVDPDLLHQRLRGSAIDNFWRGSYDLSVLSAFREVEISVREAGGYEATDIGVPLMRRAFAPNGGPLADTTVPGGEREATMGLFAGAIGLFKNANSHRFVALSARTAAELLVFASYLLELVDERRQIGHSAA